MALGQGVEERILALQGARHRDVQLGFETARHADQQRVGQGNHVRPRLGLEPSDEFFDFPCLVSRLAAQHGKRQLPQVRRASLGRLARRPSQQAARRKQIVQPARRSSEQRRFLLQVNIDAAEEYRRAGALVLFIERERQVERHHQGLVAQLAQRGDQRIIAETPPAIHRAGAGR